MSKNALAMVPMDVQKWGTITKYIKEQYKELTVEEQSAFDVLNDFWRNSNFDKIDCDENIQILVSESAKHGNNLDLKTKLQDFRELCKRYYTKEETLFKEFQRLLGGKPNQPIVIPNHPIVKKEEPQKYTEDINETYGRKEYSDGYYIGELKYGTRHGRGKYFYNNGNWDEGEWSNDKLHGNARRFFNEYERTDEGEYRDGLRFGKGRMTWSDGDWYNGGWNENGAHGYGECYYHSWGEGATYKGYFNDHQRHGKGKVNWSNGEWYDGEWKNGDIEGYGEYYYPNWGDGATYKGYFVDYKRHGNGKVIWHDGDWYDGDWHDGEMTGHGTRYYSNYKRTDTGQFLNGNRIGSGQMKWSGGDYYIGTWDDTNGNLQGQGIYYYIDGRKEKGKWKNGQWIKGNGFFPKSSKNSDLNPTITTILMVIPWGVLVINVIVTWISKSFWSALLVAIIGGFIAYIVMYALIFVQVIIEGIFNFFVRLFR